MCSSQVDKGKSDISIFGHIMVLVVRVSMGWYWVNMGTGLYLVVLGWYGEELVDT